MAQPLSKKLQIKAGQRLSIVNAPAEFSEILGALPSGVIVETLPSKDLDLALLFTHNSNELNQYASEVISSIKTIPSPFSRLTFHRVPEVAFLQLHLVVINNLSGFLWT